MNLDLHPHHDAQLQRPLARKHGLDSVAKSNVDALLYWIDCLDVRMAFLVVRRSPLRLATRLRVGAITCASLSMPRIFFPTTRTGSHFSFRMAHSPTHDTLESSLVVEEENVRGYKAEHYYPVKTGEIFQDRYSVIGNSVTAQPRLSGSVMIYRKTRSTSR